jgi:PilZ domain
MIPEKRVYRRFRLREGALVGRLDRGPYVDVVDLSVGGAGLRTDQRFAVGSEHALRLEIPEGGIDVQGVVVRSRVIGTGELYRGEQATVFAAAMHFREGSEDQIADFICGAILA